MREVAVISFAQLPIVRREDERDDIEMVLPVVTEALRASGLEKRQVGFTVSGSSDFLTGRPFSFVMALDAVGAWPPIEESHVEMDGAWALYEAWVRLQHGDIDAALVYCFGKSSAGDLRDVLVMQLDPYCTAPLWPDSVSLAALQARALLDTGRATERDLAAIVSARRSAAKKNPYAQLKGDYGVDALLEAPRFVAPLRKHDCPPISDGAAAMVLATGDLARKVCSRPAFIRGIDHRIEPHALGSRDLTRSSSTSLAAEKAGALSGTFDCAEIHAPFSHQELILQEALKLTNGTEVNLSGGALCGNPMMVAGLTRIGEAALRIHRGEAKRALAHATSGPCLQQNLVCVLEAG